MAKTQAKTKSRLAGKLYLGDAPFPSPMAGQATIASNGFWPTVLRLLPSLFVLAYAVWFSFAHASQLPYGDEYELADVMTGQRPFTLGYLFSQHNEHRIPISRLLLHVVVPLCGHDYRFAAAAVPLLVGLATAVLLAVLWLVRGALLWTDSTIALLLLNVGHVENFLWGFQLQFAANVALLLLILAFLSASLSSGQLSLRAWFGAAVCTLLLPGTGANGMVMAACVWPALGWLGWKNRGNFGQGGPWLPAVITVVGLAEVALYYTTLSRAANPSATPPPLAPSIMAFLALYAGPAAIEFWKFAGAAAILGMSTATVWLTWRSIRSRDALAMLIVALVACSFLYALAVALYRVSSEPEEAFQPRYFLLVMTVPVAIYWFVSLDDSQTAKRIRGLLFAYSLFVSIGNISAGQTYASSYQARRAALQTDLQNGVPLRVLCERYYCHPFGLYNPNSEDLYRQLDAMRRLELGMIKTAVVSPECERMDVPNESTYVDPKTNELVLSPPRRIHAISWSWSAERLGSDPRVRLNIDIQPALQNQNAQLEFVGIPDSLWSRQSLQVDEVVNRIGFAIGSSETQLNLADIVLHVTKEPSR